MISIRGRTSLGLGGRVPAADVVKSGTAFCLAKPGEVYALCLPVGGPLNVELSRDAHFTVAWWNPRNGKDGAFQNESSVAGGRQMLAPSGPGDWAICWVWFAKPAGRQSKSNL